VLRALLFLIALSLLPGQAAAEEPGRVRYAVVAGHNFGSHATSPLEFALKDARKMADLFKALGNVPEANLKLLLSPSAGQLREIMAAMRKTLEGRGEAERTELFFYYSGHANDSGLELGDELLPLKELRETLKQCGADVTIAIIDACYSGAIIREKGGKRVPLVDLTMTSEGEATGLAIITSSSAGERSQESNELRGSFFTHFVASAMRGDADASKDGRVTLHELYEYVYNKTRQRTYAAGTTSQHPTFDYAMTGRGEVVVSYPSTGRSRLLLPEELQGNFLLYSPRTDTVLAEVDKQKGEIRVLALPPGTIELFRRSDVSLQKTTLHIADGEEKELSTRRMVEVSRSYLIEKGASPRLTMAAKGGYQFFWNADVRARALIPNWLGGLEFRVRNWWGPRISPLIEIVAGGGSSTTEGAEAVGPLVNSSACFQAGLGAVFDLVPASRFRLELTPEVALFYSHLKYKAQANQDEGRFWNLSVSPQVSLFLGWEFLRKVSIGLQGKVGYLYFKDGEDGKHLGFTEAYLSLVMKL
jgi:hypothetical protein